ncbi:unnamed protein product [Amoebophrya sp. A120]|nr:unnamed protein product [Amoebophrya sp. A120]|eukprot:GSA120T00011113001.1
MVKKKMVSAGGSKAPVMKKETKAQENTDGAKPQEESTGGKKAAGTKAKAKSKQSKPKPAMDTINLYVIYRKWLEDSEPGEPYLDEDTGTDRIEILCAFKNLDTARAHAFRLGLQKNPDVFNMLPKLHLAETEQKPGRNFGKTLKNELKDDNGCEIDGLDFKAVLDGTTGLDEQNYDREESLLYYELHDYFDPHDPDIPTVKGSKLPSAVEHLCIQKVKFSPDQHHVPPEQERDEDAEYVYVVWEQCRGGDGESCSNSFPLGLRVYGDKKAAAASVWKGSTVWDLQKGKKTFGIHKQTGHDRRHKGVPFNEMDNTENPPDSGVLLSTDFYDDGDGEYSVNIEKVQLL